MAHSLETRVCSVVADVFGLPLNEVSSATSHEEVKNWDSLNIINLLVALEQEFAVNFSPDEAVKFLSVANILTVLKEKDVSPV
jgi:acyl carrier protein